MDCRATAGDIEMDEKWGCTGHINYNNTLALSVPASPSQQYFTILGKDNLGFRHQSSPTKMGFYSHHKIW